MAINFRPLSDKVLVKPAEAEQQTTGGIYIPDSAKQKPQDGHVIAVGPGRILDDGSRSTLTVKVGDRVIYSKYGGTEIKLEGTDHVILDEDQIYAIRES
jgi:chaperonin GroES